MKGKIKKFFTMDVRDHRGFTLVELIVVIAILAILAGVGTAGYAGYIKSANKNADKTLVGNIIRAIETGVYSTAFELDESFVIGDVAYPVGFVVVSTNGTKTAVSATEIQSSNSEEPCVWVTGTFENLLIPTKYAKTCSTNGTSSTIDGYRILKGEVTYCKTHSNNGNDLTTTTLEKSKEYTTGGSTCKYHILDNCQWNHTETKLEKDSKVTTGESIYLPAKADKSCCTYVYNLQQGTYTGENKISWNNDPIYNALSAAFGSVSNIKLSYDGWTSDEGITQATVYNRASDLIAVVQSKASELIGKSDITLVGSVVKNYLSAEYDDAEDMLNSFAGYMIQKYPEKESWVTIWNNAANAKFDYQFGLSETDAYHNDYIYAATTAYNNCFASYLIANGIEENLAKLIENYATLPNKTELYGIDISKLLRATEMDFIPRVANNAAFNGATSVNDEKKENTLENIFVTGAQELNNPSTNSKYTKEEATDIFGQIKNLYTQYTESSACEENGAAFYDIMKTLVTTSDVASASGDYFGYYSNYLEEMENLYKEATKYIQDGNIVIMVYVKNGEVECDVYPSAANPRKD